MAQIDLSQIKTRYPKHGKPGLCIIINNEDFETKKKREGTQKDLKGLKNVFEELSFKVECHNNCTKDRTIKILQSIKNKNNYSSLFVFFLTHGYCGGIYAVDDGFISINEIQVYFNETNCPSFKDLPKVLIFESCTTVIEGIKSYERDPEPIEAHFLLAFACQPNSCAYRDFDNGAFYIQTLVNIIREKSHTMDFFDILKEVERKFAEEKSLRKYDQKPRVKSNLIRNLYLTR
jgi:hypothetical protein